MADQPAGPAPPGPRSASIRASSWAWKSSWRNSAAAAGWPQARGELPHPLRGGRERAGLHHLSRLADRHLREVAVHVQPDTPPLCPVHLVLPPPSTASDRERVGETTPTDPRAQRNRAGRRGGQRTNTGSQPTEQERPAHPASLPSAPVPDGRTVCQPATQRKADQRRNRQRLDIFIPVTNAIESLNSRLRKVTRNRGQFPSEQAALKVLYLAVREPAGLPRAERGDPQRRVETGAAGVHDLLRRPNPHPMTDATTTYTDNRTLPLVRRGTLR